MQAPNSKSVTHASNASIIKMTAMLFMLICTFNAHATFFDIEGEVTDCDAFACDLANIAVGDLISGFLEVDTAASGPNSTFIETDILSAQLIVGTIDSGVTNGPFGSTALTTDANGEIVSGTGQLTTTIDTGFGLADVDLDLNAGSGTWQASTTFANFGVVASGILSFSRRADTDNDSDNDGVADSLDNCTLTSNPSQLDSNDDGYGNLCDPDLNNDNNVDFGDFVMLTQAFLSMPGSPNWNPDADLNGDNNVNFGDISLFPPFFLMPPGPSGIAP